jgi:ribulose-5-phosphate 4-epimerase/fuculose-1-phosphate aldolase
MTDTMELRQKLAMANRILVNENLTELGRGHVSMKIEDGKMMIPGHLHDYQRSIADCTASDIVTIDYDGKVLDGNYPESMHEFYFYSAVYQKRMEIKAALHMHAFYANLLGMSGERLAMCSRDSFQFQNGVAIFSGLPLFVNTKEMGIQMAEALGDRKVVIHRGHGSFIVGKSVEDVVTTAAAFERACRKNYYLHLYGKQIEYSDEDIKSHDSEEINEELREADWGYFVTRVEKRGMIL